MVNSSKNEIIYNAREDKISLLLGNRKKTDDDENSGKKNLFNLIPSSPAIKSVLADYDRSKSFEKNHNFN